MREGMVVVVAAAAAAALLQEADGYTHLHYQHKDPKPQP